jgi:xanthine dehydrogenase accessory factor
MDDDANVLDAAARLLGQGQRFALVTIVRTAGSTPRKAGAKMIVAADGAQHGSVGGGRIEFELVAEARAALDAGASRLVKRHLNHDLAMCCGGEVEAFVDVVGHRVYAVLVGGGHVNSALAPIAAQLGFEVVVADELEEFASTERFPAAARLVHSWEPATWGVPFGAETYVIIATRDHAVDQTVLERLADRAATPAYLGVIGSRGKMGRFRRRLEAKGVAPAWIAQVRGPVGLDVGAETPAEIAVAIAAELVAVRRRGGATRSRDSDPPAPDQD